MKIRFGNLELIEEHCGAGSSVLIPLPDGSVDLLCHRGWADKEAPQRLEEARESEFVRRALEDGADVNGFSLDEAPPSSGPLVVATLVGSTGVIEALLTLDTIPASRLNNFTIRTFFAIGEWISAALSRLHCFEQLRASPEHAHAGGSEDLVGREGVEVAAQRLHVDGLVGRGLGAVDQ